MTASKWAPSPRPEWVTELNRIGREMELGGESLASLSPESLFKQAHSRRGLDDFGGGEFREPLQVLLGSLEGQARLSPV